MWTVESQSVGEGRGSGTGRGQSSPSRLGLVTVAHDCGLCSHFTLGDGRPVITLLSPRHIPPHRCPVRASPAERAASCPFLVRCAAGRAKASPFCLGFAPCRCARDVCEIARPRCRWWAACMHGRGAHSTMHCFALSRRTSTDPLSCSASALPPLPGCAPPAHKQSHSVRAAAGRAPYPRSAG